MSHNTSSDQYPVFTLDDYNDNCAEYELEAMPVFPFKSVPREKRILLWGGGRAGAAYYEQMIAAGYAPPVYWCDKNYDKFVNDEVIKIISPDDIDINNIDIAVISLQRAKFAYEAYNFLLNKGLTKSQIVWLDKEPLRLKKDIVWSRLQEPVIKMARSVEAIDGNLGGKTADEWGSLAKNKFILPRLVTILTTHCSLKCKNCANLMPYYKDNAYNLPYDGIVKNILKVSSAVDTIISMTIIGGEPFVYPPGVV